MIRPLHPAGSAGLLAAVLLSVWPAGPARGDDYVEIRPGVEVSFTAERGKAYVLEVSADMAHWLPAGPICFGEGGGVRELFPAQDGQGQRQFFRLRVFDAGSLGLAPVSLAGRTLLLNEGFRQRRLELGDEGIARERGTAGERAHSYELFKCGPDEARLELWDDFSGHQVITLRFRGREVGLFSWERMVDGKAVDVDEGTFASVESARLPADLEAAGKCPGSLRGGSLTLDLGAARTLVVTGENRLEVASPAGPLPAEYRFERRDAELGLLRISLEGEVEEEYELHFLNRWSGSFVMRQYHKGNVEDVERGSFSLSGDLDGETGVDPGDPGNGGGGPSGGGGDPAPVYLPETLVGLSLDVLVKGKSRRLCFATADAGHSMRLHDGDLEFFPFVYSYERTGTNQARITLTFPGGDDDELEVYDLNFTGTAGGSVVRTEVEDGEEEDSERGLFTALREGCGGTHGVEWGEDSSGKGSGGDDDEEDDEDHEDHEDHEDEEEGD